MVFYATGAGQTNRAGVDGSVATAPYPVPTQKVSATIDGVPATLLYQAGAPLVLTVGDASSQTVSIAIQ